MRWRQSAGDDVSSTADRRGEGEERGGRFLGGGRALVGEGGTAARGSLGKRRGGVGKEEGDVGAETSMSASYRLQKSSLPQQQTRPDGVERREAVPLVPSGSGWATPKMPIRCVLDSRLTIPLTSALLNDGLPTIVLFADTPSLRLRAVDALREVRRRLSSQPPVRHEKGGSAETTHAQNHRNHKTFANRQVPQHCKGEFDRRSRGGDEECGERPGDGGREGEGGEGGGGEGGRERQLRGTAWKGRRRLRR